MHEGHHLGVEIILGRGPIASNPLRPRIFEVSTTGVIDKLSRGLVRYVYSCCEIKLEFVSAQAFIPLMESSPKLNVSIIFVRGQSV